MRNTLTLVLVALGFVVMAEGIANWLVMILIGNIHRVLIPSIPPIGFWETLAISLPLNAILGVTVAWAKS